MWLFWLVIGFCSALWLCAWWAERQGTRREAAIHRAAYHEGLEAGQAQGWRDAETHYQPVVAELRQRLADADLQRRVTAEMYYAAGWNEHQRYALLGNRAWVAGGERAS